ncbi:MAG: hypothetical protein IAE87_19000 [Rhodobacteraceae bacterium]|nr:hypothetical protein [Paracoccaceae bacterium]
MTGRLHPLARRGTTTARVLAPTAGLSADGRRHRPDLRPAASETGAGPEGPRRQARGGGAVECGMAAGARVSFPGSARRKILAAVMLGVVAGCGPLAPSTVRTPFPTEMIEFAFNAAMASAIAHRCPAMFQTNQVEMTRMTNMLAYKYTPSPVWPRRNLYEGLDEAAQRDMIAKYYQKRKIVPGKRSTWCAAGSSEVSEKTGIGRLLTVR